MHTSTHITIHTNNNIIEIKITRTISIRHTLTQFIIFLFLLIAFIHFLHSHFFFPTFFFSSVLDLFGLWSLKNIYILIEVSVKKNLLKKIYHLLFYLIGQKCKFISTSFFISPFSILQTKHI